MKNIFKLLAVTALAGLAAASCTKDLSGTAEGNEATVSFSVTSPVIGTKAIADGNTVTKVACYIYDDAGKHITALDKTEEMTSGKATFSATLVTGKTYQFLFWAYTDGVKGYTVNADAKTLTVDYSNASANDEARDAFYNYTASYKVTGDKTEEIRLKRPFAQINFGVTEAEWDAFKTAGGTIDKTGIKVSGAANVLNFADGTVKGSADVVFAASDIPAESEKLSVSGTDYRYLATTYVLAGKDKSSIHNITLTKDGLQDADIVVPNAPLQANWRTNIYGNLLTSTTNFNIVVEPGFEGNNDEDLKNISTTSALQALFVNGGSATLAADLEIYEPLVLEAGKNVVLDLGGKTVTFKGGKDDAHCSAFRVKGSLTIEGDGTIDGGGDEHTERNIVWANGADSKVIIKGGNFKMGKNTAGKKSWYDCIYANEGGKVEIYGGTFQNDCEGRPQSLNIWNEGEEASILVYGGTFVNYDPSTGDDKLGGSFVADGYASVTASASPLTYEVVKATKAETEDAIEQSLNVAGTATIVSKDIEVATISAKKKSILKLTNDAVVSGNGGPEGKHNDAIQVGAGANLTIEGKGTIKACTISSSQTPAINVIGGGVVNIYDGITVNGGSGSKGNYAIKLVSGTANIYGGYFCSGVNADGSSSEVIYLYSVTGWKKYAKTVLNIYGGVFESLSDPKYLVNCYDDSFKKGYCSVKIMGGTFVGFNPADNSAEGEHTNFVADGYKSQKTTYNGKDAWEVVPE